MVTQGSTIGSGIASIGTRLLLPAMPSWSAAAFVQTPTAERLASGPFAMAPSRNFLIHAAGDRNARLPGTVYLASGQMPGNANGSGGPAGASGTGGAGDVPPAGGGRPKVDTNFVLRQLHPAERTKAYQACGRVNALLIDRTRLPKAAWFHMDDLLVTVDTETRLSGQTVGMIAAFRQAGVAVGIHADEDEDAANQRLIAHQPLYRMISAEEGGRWFVFIRGKKIGEKVARPMMDETTRVLDGFKDLRPHLAMDDSLTYGKSTIIPELKLCPLIVFDGEILITHQHAVGLAPPLPKSGGEFSPDPILDFGMRRFRETHRLVNLFDLLKDIQGNPDPEDLLARFIAGFADYRLYSRWEETALSAIFERMATRFIHIRNENFDSTIRRMGAAIDEINSSGDSSSYDTALKILDGAASKPSFVWFDFAGTLQRPRRADLEKIYALHGGGDDGFPSPIAPQHVIVGIMRALRDRGIGIGINTGGKRETVERFMRHNPEIAAMISTGPDGAPMIIAAGAHTPEAGVKTVRPGEILIDDNIQLPQRLADAQAKDPGDGSIAATQAGLWTIEARVDRRELTEAEWGRFREILSDLKK